MEQFTEMLHLMPQWYWNLTVFVFGSIVGSFLNVVIYRLPLGQSIITPRSACPKCGHKITALENIPLISYILLGGKCSGCKTAISPIYPFVELLTALLFLATYFKHKQQLNFYAFFADLSFVAACICLIFIDYRHMILPDAITLRGTIVAILIRLFIPNPTAATASFFGIQFSALIVLTYLLFLAVEKFDYGVVRLAAYLLLLMITGGWLLMSMLYLEQYLDLQVTFLILWENYLGSRAWALSLANGLIGCTIGAGLLLALRQIYFVLRGIEGMGLGDVKMMLMVGFYLGWQLTIATLVIASLLGTILALAMFLQTGREVLKAKVPFGVFLGMAAIILTLYGQQILEWYFNNLISVRQ